MGVRKRTPRGGSGGRNQPVLEPLNAPHQDCCQPYPHAVFKNQTLVELYDHHQGPNCKGYMEPRSLEEFNASVDDHSSSAVRGSDR